MNTWPGGQESLWHRPDGWAPDGHIGNGQQPPLLHSIPCGQTPSDMHIVADRIPFEQAGNGQHTSLMHCWPVGQQHPPLGHLNFMMTLGMR